MNIEKCYEGESIKECLKRASVEFDIDEKFLKSKVLESKGIFRKRIKAMVWVEGNYKLLEKKHGSVYVKDGEIVVKSPTNCEEFASITPDNTISINVNGKNFNNKVNVKNDDNIKVDFDEMNAKREFKVEISDDKLKAYLEIIYTPYIEYKLKDKEEGKDVILESEIVSKKYPPAYTEEEILEVLRKEKISFGIVDENIRKIESGETSGKVLIAQGIDKNDGVDDKIKIHYEKPQERDEYDRIDFKKSKFIKNVEANEIICELIRGKDGQDGQDIFGNRLKHKKRRCLELKALNGCRVDGDFIYSTIKGRPFSKIGAFGVEEVFELNSDVNMKSGNLDFVGGIVINGNIEPGMEVRARGKILISGTVDSAKILSKSDIEIGGNVLNSTVEAGGVETRKALQIETLTSFLNNIKILVKTTSEIKEHNLLGENRSDGEIIKVLIENKFKNINKYCIQIINFNVQDQGKFQLLVAGIKQKLMGLAPITIKSYLELNNLATIAEDLIHKLSIESSNSADVLLEYVQDSHIVSSNKIIIEGKGMYTSSLIAKKSVEFLSDTSVVRGGEIKANDTIICKTVGSIGGVRTKIIVGKKGRIYIEKAYENTTFIVGEREYILEEPAKKIEVYADEFGQIVVDKFKL